MLKNSRLFYFFVTVIVVAIGILSRNINGIPLFFGDIMYAVMSYFGFRMLLVNYKDLYKITLPLAFCYLIEIQQTCNADWLLKIRQTTLGHYALGQGFLWIDIVCYTIGVFTAFWVDKWLLKINRNK